MAGLVVRCNKGSSNLMLTDPVSGYLHPALPDHFNSRYSGYLTGLFQRLVKTIILYPARLLGSSKFSSYLPTLLPVVLVVPMINMEGAMLLR